MEHTKKLKRVANYDKLKIRLPVAPDQSRNAHRLTCYERPEYIVGEMVYVVKWREEAPELWQLMMGYGTVRSLVQIKGQLFCPGPGWIYYFHFPKGFKMGLNSRFLSKASDRENDSLETWWEPKRKLPKDVPQWSLLEIADLPYYSGR